MPDNSDSQLPPGMIPAAGAAPAPKPNGGAMPTGQMPTGAPTGAMPKGGPMPPPGEIPAGGGMMKAAPGSALPPGGVMPQGGAVPPEMMPKPKTLSARPYIRRSLRLLSTHKGTVIFSAVLTLIGALMPFVVSASFGPLVQMLGRAGQTGISNVWGMTDSLYKAAPPQAGPLSPLESIRQWLATPLTFTTMFIIWAVATIGAAVLRFIQMWTMSNLEQKVVAEIQSKVYDHLQTLSLDFSPVAKPEG